MHTTARSLVLAFFLVALPACTQQVTVSDRGQACVAAGEFFGQSCERVSIEADTPLTFRVDFGTCLSSSCNEVVSSRCSVTRAGSNLDVTATATYTEEGGPFVACTTDCRFLIATCQSEPLAAGTYTVTYGGRSSTLTVPSTTAKACTPWSDDRSDVACCDSSADCVGGTCTSGATCQ